MMLKIAALVATVFIPTFGQAATIGLWTFEDGQALTDQTGHFGDLVLNGNASVQNGALTVTGAGQTSTGWAVTSSYAGGSILDKTLVSFVQLSYGATAGSAMSVDTQNDIDQFDGLIYSENYNGYWQTGSNNGYRNNFLGYGNVGSPQMQTMVVTYDDLDDVAGGAMRITGYRDGFVLNSFISNNSVGYGADIMEVMFGARHTIGGPRGGLNATIFEARLYDTSLSASEVAGLSLTPSAVPLPASMSLLLGGLSLFGFLRRKKRAAS